MRWLAVASLVLEACLLGACGSEYELVLVLPSAEARADAASADIFVLQTGGCALTVGGADPDPAVVPVLASFHWDLAGSAPVIGELDPGPYAVYARVRSAAQCQVLWAGCSELTLERDGDDRLEVLLADVFGPGCGGFEVCQGSGICACTGGQTCGNTANSFCCPSGCADLTSDGRNCGGCGNQCPGTECEATGCHDGFCDDQPEALPNGTPCGDNGVCADGRCTATCTPNDTESEDCGSCGTSFRTCNGEGQWGTWGSCEDEGACAPGDFDSEPCGDCGSRSRTCGEDCVWGDWSACTGEGECTPDATEQVNCADCGTQEQRCSDACEWELVGTCDNTPGQAAAVCADPDPCTVDACSATGRCTHGACGAGTTCCATGCQECCDDDPATCVGDPGPCNEWACTAGSCEATPITDGTDPDDECTGLDVCCAGACSECCGADVAVCGAEGLCANWTCESGACTLDPEAVGTDPEDECPGTDCCSAIGTCVAGAC